MGRASTKWSTTVSRRRPSSTRRTNSFKGKAGSSKTIRTTTGSTNAYAQGAYLNRINTLNLNSPTTIWPDRVMVKLRYVDAINTVKTVVLGSFATYTYNVNNLFSPNNYAHPGSVQDPVAGYSVLAKMYTNYRVHACRVVADIQHNVNGLTRILPIGTLAVLDFEVEPDAPISLANILASTGNPFAVYDQVNGNDSTGTRLHLENYVKLSKLLGSKQLTYDDAYAGFTVGGTPTETLTARLTIADSVGGTITGAYQVNLILSIDFYAEFYGRVVQYN